MTTALAKRKVAVKRKVHHIGYHQVMMIAAGAGIVSALLPSVPTIVKFWEDETEVSFLGQRMKYSDFLRWWVIASVVGLGVIWIKIGRR